MLDEGNTKNLDSDLTFEEVTNAVNQLSSGRVPGIDGIPAEFYKTFWGIIVIFFGLFYRKVIKQRFYQKVVNEQCSL